MDDTVKNGEYTDNPQCTFKAGNPGRPKGSKNKATILKGLLIAAVTDAAKVSGYKTAEEYLAAACSKDLMGFLRLVTPLLPKETKLDTGETLAQLIARLAGGENK